MIAKKHEDPVTEGICMVTSLTENAIAKIMALKQKCEQREGIGIVLAADFLRSLDKEGVGAIAFLKGSEYTGISFFYSFEKEEVEASIFADPDEDSDLIISSLMQATLVESKRRGHSRLLMMNDRIQSGRVSMIKAAGGKLAFSEHRMESDGSPMVSDRLIELREVGNDDEMLRSIEMECHDRFYSKPDQRRFLAFADGRTIGKIDVFQEGSDAELTGFCVLPHLRGKGLGKAILQTMVRTLRAEGKERITLDVQSDNDVALSLYLRSGFEKQFTIDYYVISLEDKISHELYPGDQ